MNFPAKILLLFASSTLCTIPAFADDAKQPNILLILADDLGYSDVGFNGSKDIATPNLDNLAKGGTICSSAYAVHPFCGPSRMGLLSGRYPHEYGGSYNLPDYSSGNYREHGIPTSETLMSTMLKEAGYSTGLMGKWHLGHQEKYHPNVRGFDDFYGFLGGGLLYFGPYQANNKQGKVWDYKVFPEHNGVDDTSLTENDYLTDVLTDEGLDFIESASKKDSPFFLMMSYNAPHSVLAATEADLEIFPNLTGKRRTYAAMVYAMDRGVGRIVESLKRNGVYENTLIVFMSDNGGRTDEGATNLPLRGVKGDTSEGGYRVPMFVHWTGKVPSERTYEHPLSALDLYPTFAILAGTNVPETKDLDGINIWEDFLAGDSARKGGMIYTIRYQNGYADVGARIDDWKITRQKNEWKLFNITNDLGEENDLGNQYPERLQQMVAKVQKYTESHVTPLWFDSPDSEKRWHDTGMPNYEKVFNSK